MSRLYKLINKEIELSQLELNKLKAEMINASKTDLYLLEQKLYRYIGRIEAFEIVLRFIDMVKNSEV